MVQRNSFQTDWVGQEVLYYTSIDSTNSEVKRIAATGAAHGMLVIADEQTGGKGRLGRSWSTPIGTAVAMSLLLRPEIKPQKAQMLTLVMGLAVTTACKELTGLPVEIKWPNDVTIHGKKLCGILTEMSAEIDKIHYVVIGVGINVDMREFPAEIATTATSLALETEVVPLREELISCCLKKFEYYYEQFLKTEDMALLRPIYQGLLANLNREVRVLEKDNEYTGIATGINDKGELLVEKIDGQCAAVRGGEVSVRGLYGYV